MIRYAVSTPAWLNYFFAVVMLAVAAYSFTLVVLGVVRSRRAGRDVELSHLFMGVAMAGMFVDNRSFVTSAVWSIIFSVAMAWFVWKTLQSINRYGLHLPRTVIDAVMNFAMLLVLHHPMGYSTGPGVVPMAASASSGGHADPGLSTLLAWTLCAAAIFTAASPTQGGSHFENSLAAPAIADISLVAMCVGMAFMLIAMT